MNKIIILCCFAFLFLGKIHAQINISAAYTRVNTDFEFNPEFDGFPQAATLALGYRVPMKQKRIEFFPQISLTQSTERSYLNKHDNLETVGQTMRLIGAKLDARFYVFDFEGDCNCPTWGNDKELFKKGFFFMATAGVHNFGLQSRRETAAYNVSTTNSEFISTFGGGIGLDIVFTERFALTPFLSYERTNTTGWGNLHPCDTCGQVEDKSAMGLLSAGLHFRYLWNK